MEVNKLSSKKGRKINLIQGYEIWTGHTELVHQSYSLDNVTNIVVSNYLMNLVHGMSGNIPVRIPNPIDFSKFNIDILSKDRNPHSIMMMYSEDPIKGSEYGLKALEKVWREITDLKVILFGVYNPSVSFPEYITYHRSPGNLRALYNQSSVFLTPSLSEGWGLPSCEAMACGCALVCTNIDGHLDYAKDNDTALLVESRNIDDMAMKLLCLLKNSEYRIKIAERGNEFIQDFTWENSLELMENVLR
jgi:glycosyltransferase involved in cell wall biosynthesis